MTQNIYLQDPNQFIQNLSQVRRSIQKNVSHKLNSNSDNVNNEIQRQIKQNFDRYKKNILINQRMQLSRQHQLSEDQKKKESIQQMIENKIKMSEEARERKKRQLLQSKKFQSQMKKTINEGKKQEIRKQNLQKSIEIIQKIEQKTGDSNRIPIKLRMLEEQIKILRLKSEGQNSLGLRERANSQSLLGKINRKNFKLMITEGQISEKSELSKEEMVRQLRQIAGMKRSKSLLQIKKQSSNNEQEMLQKLIEENQKDGYENYLLRNSLSYRASNHCRLKQVKNAIQHYLKLSN